MPEWIILEILENRYVLIYTQFNDKSIEKNTSCSKYHLWNCHLYQLKKLWHYWYLHNLYNLLFRLTHQLCTCTNYKIPQCCHKYKWCRKASMDLQALYRHFDFVNIAPFLEKKKDHKVKHKHKRETSVVQWCHAGLLANRSSDWSCARGIIHNKIRLIRPGCSGPV